MQICKNAILDILRNTKMRWGWNKKVHRYIKYPMQYYITQGSVAFENTQTVTKSFCLVRWYWFTEKYFSIKIPEFKCVCESITQWQLIFMLKMKNKTNMLFWALNHV